MNLYKIGSVYKIKLNKVKIKISQVFLTFFNNNYLTQITMNAYDTKTIKYHTNQSNPQQCHQCMLKHKYINGSKCVKHIIQDKQKNILNLEITVFDQIISNVKDIIDILPDYNSELSFVSRDQSLSQITEIMQGIDKIKDFLTITKRQKRQTQTSINYSISESFKTVQKNLYTKDQAQRNTSDKSQSLNFEIQQDIINQHIKDWIIYFSEKLIFPSSKRKLTVGLQLPFQNVIQMKMFKQNISIKYEQFMKKIDEKDRLLNQAIDKLADYIDQNQRVSSLQKRNYQNRFINSSKLLSPVTPMRALKLASTQSGRSTSRQKNKSKDANSFKINTSSFILDNISGIFPTQQLNQNIDQIYLLLSIQAQSIEKLLFGKTSSNQQNLVLQT